MKNTSQNFLKSSDCILDVEEGMNLPKVQGVCTINSDDENRSKDGVEREDGESVHIEKIDKVNIDKGGKLKNGIEVDLEIDIEMERSEDEENGKEKKGENKIIEERVMTMANESAGVYGKEEFTDLMKTKIQPRMKVLHSFHPFLSKRLAILFLSLICVLSCCYLLILLYVDSFDHLRACSFVDFFVNFLIRFISFI